MHRSPCRWQRSLYSQQEAGVQCSCPRLQTAGAQTCITPSTSTVPWHSWKLGWDSAALIAPETYVWASKSSPQPTCRQPPLHLKLNPAPQLRFLYLARRVQSHLKCLQGIHVDATNVTACGRAAKRDVLGHLTWHLTTVFGHLKPTSNL